MPMTPTQMLQTLRLAMKEKSPRTFREMKREGTLEPFLLRIATEQMDHLSEVKAGLYDAVKDPKSPHYGKTFQEQQGNLLTAIKSQEEVALHEAIEDLESLDEEKRRADRLQKIKKLTFDQIAAMSLDEVERMGFEAVLSRLREIQEEPNSP